jgi:hypothetical protein
MRQRDRESSSERVHRVEAGDHEHGWRRGEHRGCQGLREGGAVEPLCEVTDERDRRAVGGGRDETDQRQVVVAGDAKDDQQQRRRAHARK